MFPAFCFSPAPQCFSNMSSVIWHIFLSFASGGPLFSPPSPTAPGSDLAHVRPWQGSRAGQGVLASFEACTSARAEQPAVRSKDSLLSPWVRSLGAEAGSTDVAGGLQVGPSHVFCFRAGEP